MTVKTAYPRLGAGVSAMTAADGHVRPQRLDGDGAPEPDAVTDADLGHAAVSENAAQLVNRPQRRRAPGDSLDGQ